MVDALPYGSWPSPLTAAAVSAASPRLEGAQFAGDEIWWGESVPAERGRTAVRRRNATGDVVDVLPAPWNARSRVHEYGGGAWTAVAGGALAFVENTDQRIWLRRPDADPVPLTPSAGGMRFGGLTWQGGRLLAIRETHPGDPMLRPDGGPSRDIVAVPLDGAAATDPTRITSVVRGAADFYAQPTVSPDGSHLAWITWDHPDMPWDETGLMVGEFAADGRIGEARTIATAGRTTPLQPVWTGPGELTFTTDATGRWNLHRLTLDGVEAIGEPEPVAPADADTGGGLWVLGLRWYGVLADGRIVAVRTDGRDSIVLIDADGEVTPLTVDAVANTVIEDVQGTRVLLSAAGVDGPGALWLIDVDAPDAAVRIAGGAAPWGAPWLPRARPVTVTGPHGPVHAFDYPPTNPDVAGPADERPPYIVFVHGGPTSHVGGAASDKITYFTSRGIGVLDVNYGGSTGYGRAYRERLQGQWGVVDIDDVIAAASGLADSGIADPARLAIAGGSAGGWTVLCALAQSDVFSAGISRYGVADLRRLAADTHDFEARYLDGLVGPLPEAEHVYMERSPLSHLDRLRTPMLIEQGLDDEVVPPSQSEAVRDALVGNGVPHAYLAFEGEGHGFRRAETVVRALEAELAFLGQVWGFATPGVAPLPLSPLGG